MSCRKRGSRVATAGVTVEEVYDDIDKTRVQPDSQRHVDVGVHTQHHEYIGLPPRRRDNRDDDYSKLTASQMQTRPQETLTTMVRNMKN